MAVERKRDERRNECCTRGANVAEWGRNTFTLLVHLAWETVWAVCIERTSLLEMLSCSCRCIAAPLKWTNASVRWLQRTLGECQCECEYESLPRMLSPSLCLQVRSVSLQLSKLTHLLYLISESQERLQRSSTTAISTVNATVCVMLTRLLLLQFVFSLFLRNFHRLIVYWEMITIASTTTVKSIRVVLTLLAHYIYCDFLCEQLQVFRWIWQCNIFHGLEYTRLSSPLFCSFCVTTLSPLHKVSSCPAAREKVQSSTCVSSTLALWSMLIANGNECSQKISTQTYSERKCFCNGGHFDQWNVLSN